MAELDLDRLEELARAALEQIESGNEWDRQHGDALSEMDAALWPATVLRLIEAARSSAVAGETPPTDHKHYWVDAPDDETGWQCTICGVTEYSKTPPYGAEPSQSRALAMTSLTEDELARLEADVRALPEPTLGLKGGVNRAVVLSLIAALRVTPVADTAGIDAAQKFIESITVFVPVDAELVNATLAELQESPLPGARYAHDVVKRRFAAALRTPKPEGER